MKVLYILDTINVGGAETSLIEIAKHFTIVEPVFVHIYKGDILKDKLLDAGITVHSINLDEKYGYAKAITELKKIYELEAPDLVHSTLYRSDMIARKMKSHFPNIPLVGSFVNNSYTSLRYTKKPILLRVKLYLAYLQDKISSKKVDFYISNSETIKKLEGNALGVPPDKIKVIYRGRDIKKFDRLNSEKVNEIKKKFNLSGKNVILNVSRLIERKGQLDLIKIMPDIIREFPNTVLIIAGEGSLRKQLELEISNLNLNNHVFLIGRFSDIPELLEIANLFVYPSYLEGLPGALIEAMMAAKIIINSDIGENLECVENDTSITYPVGDTEKLKQNILKVLYEPESYKPLGAKAKELAIKKFSIENISKSYENTYSEVLSKF